jgi:Tfp pilus assembly protein FimT
MTIKTNRTKLDQGFTLVETLFYIAGVITLLSIIVITLFNTYDWYRTSIVYPRVNQDGSLIISRIGNDIRSGSALNPAQNVFNVSNGAIGITGLDASQNSVSYYYFLQNGRIAYQKNGGETEYLSPANVHVSKLQFNQLDTPISTAVRVVVDIGYKTKTGTTTNTYSTLGIMRNSYE